MKIRDITEMATAGGMSSGSVATVSAPLGKTRRRKKTAEDADPHGGSMISPYENEPSDQDVNDAMGYAKEAGMNWLHDQQQYDIQDPAERHDLVGDLAHAMYNALEQDNMDYFTDKQLMKMAGIILTKHLGMV